MRICGYTIIFISVCFISRVASASSFQIMGAEEQFRPRALSADGSTLVGTGLSPNSPQAAIYTGMVWSPAQGLSFMPSTAPYVYPSPTCVSPNGMFIAGGYSDGNGGEGSFLWTAATGYQSIPPSIAGDFTQPVGVSSNGQTIAGYMTPQSGAPPAYAFVWTSAGGSTTLPVAVTNSLIMSEDGSTLAGDEAATDTPFTWTATGGVVPMNTLPNVNNVDPLVISSDGSRILGTATTAISTNPSFLFSYSNGVMTSLGAPSFYSSNAQASPGLLLSGATADGSEMVGTQLGIPSSPTTAPEMTNWVWTASGGFESLQDVLSADGIDVGSYEITGINGISADGTVLCGTGLLDGSQASGWVAVVPEPSAIMAGIAISAFISLRRRRSFCTQQA